MTTKVFPDGPELSLDQPHVKELIRQAINGALRDLAGTDITGAERLIYRIIEPGHVEGKVAAWPFYRRDEVWDKINKIWKSNETIALTDYLWSRGALKQTLYRDGDQDPDKDAWAQFVWAELVHAPLLDLLPKAAAKDLALTGSYQPWCLDEITVEQAASDLADQICEKGRTVVAFCPTLGLQLAETKTVTAAAGIEIKVWSDDDRAIFLTEFGEEYLRNDMSTWFGQSFISIHKRVVVSSEDAALAAVALALDSVKWAVVVASNDPGIFDEGPVVSFQLSGRPLRTLRRSDTLMRSRKIPNMTLTPEVGARLPQLFEELDQAQRVSAEIDSAIWLFGRACTAALARDSLLDSVIGLETILVPSSGDSRYRFTLHGLAVIEGEPAQTLEADLKKIYNLRSKAAHDGSSKDDFEKFAPRAKLLLAKAIRGVVQLVRNGQLDVVSTNGDIAQSVENLVKSRARSQ